MLQGQKIVLGIMVTTTLGLIVYCYTQPEENPAGKTAACQTSNPTWCPDGETAIAIPADATSAEVKKIAEEMAAKYAGCRTTIIVGPKRDSNFTNNDPSKPPARWGW